MDDGGLAGAVEHIDGKTLARVKDETVLPVGSTQAENRSWLAVDHDTAPVGDQLMRGGGRKWGRQAGGEAGRTGGRQRASTRALCSQDGVRSMKRSDATAARDRRPATNVWEQRGKRVRDDRQA